MPQTPLPSPPTDRASARLAWTRDVLGDPTLTLAPASADASFRSYWRTFHQDISWIVMDSPPALEDPAPWLAIGRRLHAAGLHVPSVRAHDLERGFVLIEDLGSRLYLDVLDEHNVERLYGDALAALLHMQRAVDGSDLPPYDAAFLQRELALLPEWFLGRHLGVALDDPTQATLQQAFARIVDAALEQPHCFVHRDFHSRNLLLVEPAQGARDNPGIIDFQGALHGPITYDLASLLRDCYIAWEPARVQRWALDYHARLVETGLVSPTVDPERFLRWFDLAGLQRHLKVLGIFCRLWYRDGKRRYLDDLPLVYRYVIEVAGRYPELRALARLLEQCVGDRDITRPAG